MSDTAEQITTLMADTANGIQVIKAEDHPKAWYMTFDDFIEALPRMKDGEVIYCNVNGIQKIILENDYKISA